MAKSSQRSVEIHYGTLPLAQLLGSLSVESCTAGNSIIHEHDFAASIGQIRSTDHTEALHTAKLHRLEVGNQQNLLSNEIFRRIPLGDT